MNWINAAQLSRHANHHFRHEYVRYDISRCLHVIVDFQLILQTLLTDRNVNNSQPTIHIHILSKRETPDCTANNNLNFNYSYSSIILR